MSEAWESEERDDRGRFSGGGSGGIPTLDTGASGRVEGNAAGAADNAFAAAAQPITPAQLSSLDNFQAGGYTEGGSRSSIQGQLYAGKPLSSAAEEGVRNIDEAIAAQDPTATDAVLYRGVPEQAKTDYASLQPGDTFQCRGFSSCSAASDNPRIDPGPVPTGEPEKFSEYMERYENAERDKVAITESKLEIHAPAGSQGLNMNSFKPNSDFTAQHEVVLPRGSEFQVTEQVPRVVEGRTLGTTTVVNLVPRR